MIHYYSLGRAARYFPEQTALVSHGTRSTFGKLHGRVARRAGALTRHGFKAGDRLAILLPNESDYIELVYACVWRGVVAVPLNTRLSAVEIDRVLEDASPHGLIRHSSPVQQHKFRGKSYSTSKPWMLVTIHIPLLSTIRKRSWRSFIRAARPADRKAFESPTQISWRTFITSTSGFLTSNTLCICTRRQFFTSRIFQSSSQRQLSAPARSRFPSSIRKPFAKLSNVNGSATRF